MKRRRFRTMAAANLLLSLVTLVVLIAVVMLLLVQGVKTQ